MKLQEKGGFQGIPEIGLTEAQLWSHFVRVKIFRKDPKSLGQPRFGPNLTVEIEAAYPENFRSPYPLLLLLKEEVFKSSFFGYVPSPWSKSSKRKRNLSISKDENRRIALFLWSVDFNVK